MKRGRPKLTYFIWRSKFLKTLKASWISIFCIQSNWIERQAFNFSSDIIPIKSSGIGIGCRLDSGARAQNLVLLARNWISNSIVITSNVTSFKKIMFTRECNTKGRTNSITDLDDFLFKIETKALLSVWNSIFLSRNWVLNKKKARTIGTNSKNVIANIIFGSIHLWGQNIPIDHESIRRNLTDDCLYYQCIGAIGHLITNWHP